MKIDRKDLEDWKIFVRGICSETKKCRKFPDCSICLEDFKVMTIKDVC